MGCEFCSDARKSMALPPASCFQHCGTLIRSGNAVSVEPGTKDQARRVGDGFRSESDRSFPLPGTETPAALNYPLRAVQMAGR